MSSPPVCSCLPIYTWPVSPPTADNVSNRGEITGKNTASKILTERYTDGQVMLYFCNRAEGSDNIQQSFIHPSSIVSCLSGSTSQGQQSKHTCPNISLLSHLILGSSQAFPGQLTDVISPQSASIWPCLKHLT